jgi:hypothetical protein
MRLRQFLSIFTAAAVATWIFNILWLAVLAAPVSWLWNHAVAPLGGLPDIGYGRTFGLLLFWFLLCLAHAGVTLSAISRGGE